MKHIRVKLAETKTQVNILTIKDNNSVYQTVLDNQELQNLKDELNINKAESEDNHLSPVKIRALAELRKAYRQYENHKNLRYLELKDNYLKIGLITQADITELLLKQ